MEITTWLSENERQVCNLRIVRLFSVFPSAPITLDQVRLLEKDNIVPEKEKGFKELGIKPESIFSSAEEHLIRYISRY